MDTNKIESFQQNEEKLTSLLKKVRSIFQKKSLFLAHFNPLDAGKKDNFLHAILEELAPYKTTPLPKDFNIDFSGTVSQYLDFLEHTYGATLAVEVLHIPREQRIWIYKNIESLSLDDEGNSSKLKLRLLDRLIASKALEECFTQLHPKIKRYSIEGADTLLVGLESVFLSTAELHDLYHIFLGLTHRGRLNIIVNLLGKSPISLFEETDFCTRLGYSGDVSYHMGYDTQINLAHQNVSVHLLPNPSHLESISSVLLGATRAQQDQLPEGVTAKSVLPVIVHGDAAFSGQGIVMESLNMSKIQTFSTQGAIHFIIDNQIGATNSNAFDARSTQYCTDIAKAFAIPVLHVNGDDPHAVYRAGRLASRWRAEFGTDIIIHLVCYRRYGHYDLDNPMATQPLMYRKIASHPTPLEYYANQLKKEGLIDDRRVQEGLLSYQAFFNREHADAKTLVDLQVNSDDKPTLTPRLKLSTIQNWTNKLENALKHIHLHDLVQKIYSDRFESIKKSSLIDWPTAEMLAFASLIQNNISVRLVGQDSQRGCFFQRHATVHDQKTHQQIIPLHAICSTQKLFVCANSLLSEQAVMGFEYGYSVAHKSCLTIWEAQFGDFVNGAQIIIDQYLVSGEQKWLQHSNLVLFLPHGYEGGGPEHSSARLERFLQLAAQDNIKVCYPSDAAQLFHLLRDQAYMSLKKPLIILTPKLLLKNSLTFSSLENLITGDFKRLQIIPALTSQPTRVVFCSGKIFIELKEILASKKELNIMLVSLEQFYPFPTDEVEKLLTSYLSCSTFYWVQEEPKNQGAWLHVLNTVQELFPEITLHYVGRPPLASTADGSLTNHEKTQKNILNQALGFL